MPVVDICKSSADPFKMYLLKRIAELEKEVHLVLPVI